MVDIVHKNNSYLLLDLVHQGVGSSAHYSPSGGKLLNLDFESKAMTKEDILKIQNDFVQAALRAKKAGYDGVEIQNG